MGDPVSASILVAASGAAFAAGQGVKKALTPSKPGAPGAQSASVDVEGAAAAERERLRMRRQRGRAATILTSALGDQTTPNLGKKVLLGS